MDHPVLWDTYRHFFVTDGRMDLRTKIPASDFDPTDKTSNFVDLFSLSFQSLEARERGHI